MAREALAISLVDSLTSSAWKRRLSLPFVSRSHYGDKTMSPHILMIHCDCRCCSVICSNCSFHEGPSHGRQEGTATGRRNLGRRTALYVQLPPQRLQDEEWRISFLPPPFLDFRHHELGSNDPSPFIHWCDSLEAKEPEPGVASHC